MSGKKFFTAVFTGRRAAQPDMTQEISHILRPFLYLHELQNALAVCFEEKRQTAPQTR